LLLVFCLVLGRAGTSVAATGASLASHGAATEGGAPAVLAAAESKGGPTPYPTDETDWPGVGVIRVFDFMTQIRQYFWSQRLVNQGAVVFAGDSNIGGWTTLKEDFSPLPVANVGIGGDVSRGLLFRLKEDVIDLIPRAVVILIGFNDLSAKEQPSLFVSNVKSILKMLRDYSYSLPIVLCNLPPGDSKDVSGVSRTDRLELNSRLDSLSTPDPNLVLLDLYHLLTLPDGSFDYSNFYADRLHISPVGYKKFHNALISIFRRLQVE
jgi:lysophospholipase L1-like esterase